MSSSQQETVLAFIKYINAKDYTSLATIFSDNFTHEFRPASLAGMGAPIRDKKQMFEFLDETDALIASFNYQEPKEVIAGKDVVVVHLASDGKTTIGTPFTNEYIFIFRFDGEKIVSMKEFMDSKYVAETSAEVKATLGGQAVASA